MKYAMLQVERLQIGSGFSIASDEYRLFTDKNKFLYFLKPLILSLFHHDSFPEIKREKFSTYCDYLDVIDKKIENEQYFKDTLTAVDKLFANEINTYTVKHFSNTGKTVILIAVDF